MSAYDDKKDAQGRSWDQITKNGTGSAASVGVGGTGDSGKLQREGSQQSASRTDDLLDDGSSQENDTGYSRGGGQVQTGLEGIGKLSGNLSGGAQGNRQSGESQGRREGDKKDGQER